MVSLIYAAFSWAVTILISVTPLSGLDAIVGIGSSIVRLPILLLLFVLGFHLLFQTLLFRVFLGFPMIISKSASERSWVFHLGAAFVSRDGSECRLV
jgi:hypothetical protein